MIKEKIDKYPCLSCIIVFIICGIVRCFEYFVIRSDETILAENFIHKIFGILLLCYILKVLQLTWQDIGFKTKTYIKHIGLGVLLGFICFTISYIVEIIVMFTQNKNPHIEVYASGFSMTGEMVKQTGIEFILLCIAFNMINVWMEEGIFRGLYLNILKSKYSFWIANIISAFLFGVWHWVMPLRSYSDGDLSLSNLLVMGIGYIFIAGIMSIKWGVLYEMSGSLWIGLGDHLYNNVVATNLLHIVSNFSTDEFQIVRIMLAQLLSFVFVMIIYKKRYV